MSSAVIGLLFVVGAVGVYVAGALHRTPKGSVALAVAGVAMLAAIIFWPAAPPEVVEDPELVERVGAAQARADDAETRLEAAIEELARTRGLTRKSSARVSKALAGADPASDLIVIDMDRNAARLLWTTP